jgi:hypothetical protein
MPKLDTQHPQYEANLSIWEMVEDCDAGEKAIKEKGDKYLPRPNPADKSEENKQRFEQYKTRAVFVNFTNRTVVGLVGQVTARPPDVELPTAIEDLQEDIDGSGISLDQQSRRCLSRVLKVGRSALFVDYPQEEGPVRRGKINSGESRPTIVLYPATAIDYWRTERRGSKDVYTLIKIREKREMIDPDDVFESKEEDIYRVLRLDEAGYYYQQIWVKQTDAKTKKIEWVQDGEDTYPQLANGSRLKEIPLQFVGSINNDSDADKAPMGDIAGVNIGHYRNSADYEEACYVAGQPTIGVSIGKWTLDQFKTANPGGIRFGILGGIQFGEGGSIDLIQAEANSMPKEAMEMKEAQMAIIGASIISETGTQKTAYQANIENTSETSQLKLIAQNVSNAYERALEWFAAFLPSATGEIKYQLNTNFDSSGMDYQELLAMVQAWQSGAIAKTALHAWTVKKKIEDRDFEEVEDEIDDNPPAMALKASAPSQNLEDENPQPDQ